MIINEPESFSEVFTSYYVHLINSICTRGKTCLKSFCQLPHASSYVRGVENTIFADDVFKNSAPDMKTYHLPDSCGSYLSRFHNDTSHILLTMARYINIFTTIIDDVFIILNVDHHDDAILISLNISHVQERTGWTHPGKSGKYRDMRNRRLGISNEYVESIYSPMKQQYHYTINKRCP